MSPHVKHVILGVLGVIGLIGGIWVWGYYDARKASIQAQAMKDRDIEIAKNQATVKAQQPIIQTAQNANTALDQQKAAHDAQMAAELATKLTAAQVNAIVEAKLAGATTTTNPNGTVDIHTTADAINKANVAFETCQFNLSDCQQKQANLNTIIGAQNQEIAADKSTIDLQLKQMNDLRKFQVPRAWFGVGFSKQPGAFNQAGSYQVVGALGYRFAGPVGIAAIAQNRSVGVMVTYNFGKVAK